MDRYQVLEEWRAGTFGEICVVKDQAENLKYAVKKVECMDEREANLALKEISSLYFCLVMDLVDHGDLTAIVRRNREQEKKIDEKVVQVLLGQTIDALVYIHKQKVVHRNLKPSNILLKDEDSFLISDFLLETLVTDEMKMKVRVDPEWKLWMSPEALQFSYSEKSDIWSFGCILLDVMTCSTHTDVLAVALLQEIRVDPLCLETVLKKLQNDVGYSADLCQVLLPMLRIDPRERSSAIELVDIPYVRKCLAVVGSPLSGLKKTLPAGIKDELEEGGIEKAIEIMRIYPDCEDAQVAAISLLSRYTAQQQGVLYMEEILSHVVQAMSSHGHSLDLQIEGSRILQELIPHALEQVQGEEWMSSNKLIAALVGGVRSFPQSADLLSLSLSVMMIMSANEVTAEMLVKAGFLEDTVKVMEHSLENREMCVSCCRLLWSMAMTSVAERQTQREWLILAVQIISNVIQKHLQDWQIVESACCALWILCLKGYVLETEIETISWVLLESLQAHSERPVLVKNACLSLASLIRASELAAYRVLVPTSGKGGISIIKYIYQMHTDDPEITENICLLLYEMTQYGDPRPELLAQNIDRLLHDIKDKFESTEEIVTLAQTTLSKLEH
ncbi:serine/threonine kinase-like domain-containing protein STKLD1 [Rhinophrynus dorsalis]